MIANLLLGLGLFTAEIRITTTPGRWVEPLPRAEAARLPARRHFIDLQVNRALDPPQTFIHEFRTLRADAPYGANLVDGFSENTQAIVFHQAVLHRGAATIALPIRDHVVELVLPGNDSSDELTAVFTVDRGRVGDVLELAYTIVGDSPNDAGHFDREFQLAHDTPTQYSRFRLVWPSGRTLHVMPWSNGVKPEVRRRGATTEYFLEGRDLPALAVEPDTPDWFDAAGTVTFSDYADWNAFARFEQRFFRETAPPSPELAERVEACAHVGRTREEHALAAIRFVQRNIAYRSGFERGYSRRAMSADSVLSRGYGDCKDKSVLLAHLLNALGFPAEVALVHTEGRDTLAAMGPSDSWFDHVIVRFDDHGRKIWVDPTNSVERGGSISTLARPGYRWAFVIADTTTGLTRLPAGWPSRITITKSIRPEGDDARMDVSTLYRGPMTMGVRAVRESEGLDSLTIAFLAIYRQEYPGVELAAPLRVEDDQRGDSVRVDEHYRIRRFWRDGRASFAAPEVTRYLPRTERRTMPMNIPFDTQVDYDATIVLPAGQQPGGHARRFAAPAVTGWMRFERTDHAGRLRARLTTAGGDYAPETMNAAEPAYRRVLADLTPVVLEHAGLPPPARVLVFLGALLAAAALVLAAGRPGGYAGRDP